MIYSVVPLTSVISFFSAGAFFSVDLALRRACLLANGVLANSLEEAEADVGLVGVRLGGAFVVGVVLEDRGVLAVGVWGLEAGVVALSALTLAALASLSLLVLVVLGVIFILVTPAGFGVGVVEVELVVLVSGLAVCAALLAVLVVVVVAGLDVSGLVVGGFAVGAVAGLVDAGRVEGLAAPLVNGLALAWAALDGLVVVFGPVVGAALEVAGALVVVGADLGLVVALVLGGAGPAFPAALGVVFVNARVVGGLGDFLVADATDLAALATSSAETFSSGFISG